jgi:cysteine desulfurase
VSVPPTGGVYLDYAASTPVDPAVVQCVCDALGSEGAVANPSSAHPAGRAAAQRIEAARQRLATAIGAQAREIIWTSGATEADNLAVLGGARMQRARGRGHRVVTVATEHDAVLAACERLELDGFAVTRLRPDADGYLAPDALAAVLADDVALVSVMSINNETGVIQDVVALGELAHAYGAVMHIDAAQGMAEWPSRLADWPIDLVSLSAHKWYGPPGVGALWRRIQPRTRLDPVIIGGGQEAGLRSGTLALHQIAGMARAYELWAQRRAADEGHVAHLRDCLEAGLAGIGGLVRNGRRDGSARILNVSVVGVHGDALRAALGDELTVSAGSACSSREGEPSHVLRAMGRPDALAAAALRISLGRDLTESQIREAVMIMDRVIAELRGVSPAWRHWQAGVGIAALYGMPDEPSLVV